MIKLEIKRPNGELEIVDVTNVFAEMSSNTLYRIYTATKNAGKGEVISATTIQKKTNIQDLIKKYNNAMNEGGEGYVPENSYFERQKAYREWDETTVLKVSEIDFEKEQREIEELKKLSENF